MSAARMAFWRAPPPPPAPAQARWRPRPPARADAPEATKARAARPLRGRAAALAAALWLLALARHSRAKHKNKNAALLARVFRYVKRTPQRYRALFERLLNRTSPPPPPPSQRPTSATIAIPLLPHESFIGAPSTHHNLRHIPPSTHTAPHLVSTAGRYISSTIPFTTHRSNSHLHIRFIDHDEYPPSVLRSRLSTSASHRTLRGAVRALTNDRRDTAATTTPPDPLLFTAPVYAVGAELGASRTTQARVISYAEQAIRHNLPAGVLCIDADGWMDHRGSHTFDEGRFPDPPGLIRHLHALGFKVCLHVTPLVSPDSVTYDELSGLRALMPLPLHRHRGGLSALLDTQNAAAIAWLRRKLAALRDLGVDGFAPDGGSPVTFQTSSSNPLAPYVRCRLYAETVLEACIADSPAVCLCEASWAMFDRPVGVRLPLTPRKERGFGDGVGVVESHEEEDGQRKRWHRDPSSVVVVDDDDDDDDDDGEPSVTSFRDVRAMIRSTLALGVAGLPFACPSPAGGIPPPPKPRPPGLKRRDDDGDDEETRRDVDPELLVRHAQAMALLPMMRLGIAPWRQLNESYLRMVVEAARLRTRMGPSIVRLAHKALADGDPIVRPVAYHFPSFRHTEGAEGCFLLGNVILVAPVLRRGSRSRLVAFPPGMWEGMDGVRREGPCVAAVASPLAVLPWFCRLDDDPRKGARLRDRMGSASPASATTSDEGTPAVSLVNGKGDAGNVGVLPLITPEPSETEESKDGVDFSSGEEYVEPHQDKREQESGTLDYRPRLSTA